MKVYVVIDDTNGVYKSRGFKTSIEAEAFAFNAIKDSEIESELIYVTVQEIEVEVDE